MIAEQIKSLRKIQHLVLIRDEEANVGTGERIDDLSNSIDKIADELDAESAKLYARLSAKNKIFLSPIAKGNCSACGLKLPTAVLQHVLACSRYVVCSSCGRLLYQPEVKSTGVRTGLADTKYLLSRFSSPALMIPELKAETREDAIAELCDILAGEKVIPDPKAVVAAALERESILTTAVGNGLAFPHMRGVEEGVLTFAAGISHKGIDWGGQRVELVVFTALPVVASPFYLKLLGAFAKSFDGGDKLPFVTAATDAKTMWKELNKAMRVAVKNI